MGALKMEVLRGYIPGDPSQTDTDIRTIRAIQHLSRMSPDALQMDVVGSLALEKQYCMHLVDPTVLSAEESVTAGKYLAGVDTQFLSGIIAAANQRRDRTHMTRTLHIVNGDIGYIGGGDFPVTDHNGNIITLGTSFIMRTLNGGASWSTVSSSTTRMPVMNVNMVNDTTGFAVTARKTSSPTASGVFLRTTTGTSWTTGTRDV